jgi:hypothetical protein
LLIVLLAAGAASGVASGPGITVTIRAGTKNVKDGENFPVTTTIQNTGKSILTLHVMSCSYNDHWVTSSAFVHVMGISCDKNVALKEILEPGKVYKRDLYVSIGHAWNTTRPSSVTFRLGFKNGDGQGNTELSKPVWGNPITIAVRE